MNTEDNYRIKIEEWKEQVQPYEVPIKHKTYTVQKTYIKYNWFDRNIIGRKNIWYTQSVHSDMDEAIMYMRNLHNRENPVTKYYHKSTIL
jgi:hypothetical protein